MAVHKAVWVSCDVCGEEMSSADYGDSTAVEARRAARQDGGHRSRGRDICEDCWEDGKRG